MNIIDESFVEKKAGKKKLLPKIIIAVVIILVICIIGVIIALAYIDNSTLKVYINGAINSKVKDMLVFEGDTIYVPIRDIASYLGYESYNGDYSTKSEEKNKCYIQSEYEIANFVLNSNKIYKLETQEANSEYEYFYSKKPVKSINGKLYISSDGIEQAFNVSFAYNIERQRIYIYTMDNLINSYQNLVLDNNYAKISEEFNDQKAIFEERLVVVDTEEQMGVIDLDGKAVIESKYDKVQYIPQTGDFLAESNGKVGIISKDGAMKVQLMYDSLQLMDRDAGLYVAEREDKYGIIDIKGNTKLYIENEQVGMDISSFEKNDIRNKYILLNSLIPVKRNGLWGLVNTNGQTVVDFKYDGFGYIASSNKDALNLLVIPNYNVIVVKKDNKYGLINTSGQEVLQVIADDIYMTIESNKTYYYFNVLDKRYDAEGWLDLRGVKQVQTQQESNTSNSNTSNNSNITNTNGNETNTSNTADTDVNTTDTNNTDNAGNNGGEIDSNQTE